MLIFLLALFFFLLCRGMACALAAFFGVPLGESRWSQVGNPIPCSRPPWHIFFLSPPVSHGNVLFWYTIRRFSLCVSLYGTARNGTAQMVWASEKQTEVIILDELVFSRSHSLHTYTSTTVSKSIIVLGLNIMNIPSRPFFPVPSVSVSFVP